VAGDVTAIKAKTDNLPSDPADASDIASAFGTVNGTLATIAGYVDTEVAAIKAKTDNLPATPASSADVSALDSALTAIDAKLGTPAGASVSADVAAVKTDTAAIKTKTDPLTFTVANKLDANIHAVNDVNVRGTGAAGDTWGP
jgi:CCR4-NOT transcriptional regulation complex NOT5 subunit